VLHAFGSLCHLVLQPALQRLPFGVPHLPAGDLLGLVRQCRGLAQFPVHPVADDGEQVPQRLRLRRARGLVATAGRAVHLLAQERQLLV